MYATSTAPFAPTAHERISTDWCPPLVYSFSRAAAESATIAHTSAATPAKQSATSPVLYKDLVIVNASVESGNLVALDRKTGKEVWKVKGIRESWNTPIILKLKDRTVFLDVRTDPTENVWPMVQAGKGISEMLLGSEDL